MGWTLRMAAYPRYTLNSVVTTTLGVRYMPEILCPICDTPVIIAPASCTCAKGHEFSVKNNIVDFLPNIDEDTLKDEEQHWDQYAEKGKSTIEPNSYIKSKILRDYETLYYRYLVNEWPDYRQKKISIAELGCGYGSALRFLTGINFANVDYIGIDISIKSMLTHFGNKSFAPNWKVRFVRASANKSLFKDNALDMVFSTSALHHLDVFDVIKWTSKSLKHGGLFIMMEPSDMNPFAKLGRKFARGMHTMGEKPLNSKKIKKIANEHDLILNYEKGLHFLSGPMMYCAQILHFPKPVSVFSYYVSKLIDLFTQSPSWNYSFVQVYRRV